MDRRILRVSPFFLEMFLRGEAKPVKRTTAPRDLRIVGVVTDRLVSRLDMISRDRVEEISFVVESASFGPLGTYEDPKIEPRYSVGSLRVGPFRWLRRFLRAFRLAWRVA